MSKKVNKPRRALTATMSLALLISLSSCSGATNTVGKLNANDVYASAGNYSVTYGELWNELKWDAATVIEQQVTNVVLYDYIDKITLVVDNQYSELSEDDKENLGIETEEEFNKLHKTYTTRLVDYVVYDIYNLSFQNDDYWDSVKDLKESTIALFQQKYVDEIFSTYQISEINGVKIADLIANPGKDNFDNYLKIATALRQAYFPMYAKEVLAYEKLNEDVLEAYEDDDDEDDNNLGYFANTDYVGKFKNEYTNTYDLNLVMINFSSTEEYNDTLRAFGLKMYNKKLYFIKDETDSMSYEDYIEYYDDFSNADLNKEHGVEELAGEVILELYIQLYNYLYSGYREPLSTNYPLDYSDITTLRKNTFKIISEYSQNPQEKYNNAVAKLLADNKEEVTFSSESLLELSATFKSYVYETLKLTDKNGNETMDTRYSTSTTSANKSQYIVFKFGEEKDNIADEILKSYEEFYNKDLTTYEILDFITDSETNPTLFDDIVELLVKDEMSTTTIDKYVAEEELECTVKVYNEAIEIVYANSHSEYSKSMSKPSNSNVLATVDYNKKTWNINIAKDENDSKSIVVPATLEKFGTFEHLEMQSGAMTAVDLISNKVVKDTKQYAEAKKDKEIVETYENYLKLLLTSFSNGGMASNGYSADIGKYNFLMLYFHTADFNEIISDYFLVQHASTKLLTDYSNDDLIAFFKEYTDTAYKDYFSLSGTRLVVYMDADDDTEADDLITSDSTNWIYKEVEFEGNTVTLEYVAKDLIYEIYNKISASVTDHATKMNELIDEINNSAKAIYGSNPIVAENTWAKYRKLGLKVKSEEFSATNSSVDLDFNLKQRLYDYARGYSQNDQGDITKTYQYFIGDSVPTAYIEPLTAADVSTTSDAIISTNDGYNLLLVTNGTSKASAEWKAEDNDDGLFENIVIKYNEEFIKIDNIFNEGNNDPDLDGALNTNQIKLYVLDHAINGSSVLSPSGTATALSTFLEPVVKRYSSAETQRIILLSFIKAATNQADSTELYDVVRFDNEDYNGVDGLFAKLITINQNVADDYIFIYKDPTNTSNAYPDWWSKLEAKVNEFLIKMESEDAE